MADWATSSTDLILVSRETEVQLQAYGSLLALWNSKINLVARADLDKLRLRHIEDSLSLVPEIPSGANQIVDLGSGGGLPAIPLTIVTGTHIAMIESDRRKAAFLQTAVATLNLNASVICARAEIATSPPGDVVTARALAPLDVLLGYAQRHMTASGIGLFLKGSGAEAEIDAALNHWDMDVHLLQAPSGHSRIVKVTNLHPRRQSL